MIDIDLALLTVLTTHILGWGIALHLLLVSSKLTISLPRLMFTIVANMFIRGVFIMAVPFANHPGYVAVLCYLAIIMPFFALQIDPWERLKSTKLGRAWWYQSWAACILTVFTTVRIVVFAEDNVGYEWIDVIPIIAISTGAVLTLLTLKPAGALHMFQQSISDKEQWEIGRRAFVNSRIQED